MTGGSRKRKSEDPPAGSAAKRGQMPQQPQPQQYTPPQQQQNSPFMALSSQYPTLSSLSSSSSSFSSASPAIVDLTQSPPPQKLYKTLCYRSRIDKTWKRWPSPIPTSITTFEENTLIWDVRHHGQRRKLLCIRYGISGGPGTAITSQGKYYTENFSLPLPYDAVKEVPSGIALH